jgi:Zn finger protein HypA/HybF involved in hydrogenase expression
MKLKAVEAFAHQAKCNRCKDVLLLDELMFQDLKKLSCSKCYSSNIVVTQVRFEVPDDGRIIH